MSATSTASGSAVQRLVAEARYEVIPLKNLEPQIPHLPAGCSVSVTCSPTKGQQATLDLTARLADLGHLAVPHLSARLVEDRAQVAALARFCRDQGVQEVFLVAGDPPQPAGPYDGVVAFLRDFLAEDHGLRRIGITAYPDGHALIPLPVLHEALHTKQTLLAEAGVSGFASTQMCFDVRRWTEWCERERAAGFALPVHIGVPGAIDRAKLLSMGMRLGIGQSMRFVKKQGGALGRLFRPGGYDPMRLITPLARRADDLGLEGLHLFTFNNVEATVAWQRSQAG